MVSVKPSSKSKAPAKPKRQGTKASIVLVEDDTFLAGLYVTKLSLENFDVKLATNGEEGLRMIQETLPDLVLLDIRLPKMDGFEVLRFVKRTAATKNVPVILLTNVGTRDDVERGLALGADDYLIKAHFLPSEVIAKVRDHLSPHALPAMLQPRPRT